MSRRRRQGRRVDGWVVVDKPVGISSAAAVAVVRRRFDAAKAGHGGTLDPLASGILPIALGEATKTVSYVMDGAKRYRFTVAWGQRRDTDDAEGRVIAESNVRPTASDIEAALVDFTGTISQIPPMFSAVKVSGRRSYARARGGEQVSLAARQVHVGAIDLVDALDPNQAVFEAETGKGVYIRSLARDIATRLGTEGYVAHLRRLRVGPFSECRAVPLDTLKGADHNDIASEILLPVDVALADIPALMLTEPEAWRLQRGQLIPVRQATQQASLTETHVDSVVCAMTKGRLVALAQREGGFIKPLRVLNL